MAHKSEDLHGSAPDNSAVALLLVDVINILEFPGGEQLLVSAQLAKPALVRLIERARQCQVPILYLNDNFGRWQSDFNAYVNYCLGEGSGAGRGRDFVHSLQPTAVDYFVLKPKHSGFYASPLDLLLRHLAVKRLVIAGITADSCVFFTACDAYLRDYELTIAKDCVVGTSIETRDAALAQMHRMLKAQIVAESDIDFADFQSLDLPAKHTGDQQAHPAELPSNKWDSHA